jgi:hypothetical protein
LNENLVKKKKNKGIILLKRKTQENVQVSPFLQHKGSFLNRFESLQAYEDIQQELRKDKVEMFTSDQQGQNVYF